MGYVDPKEVKSPREKWTLIDVLYDGGEGPGAHAIAIGEWDGRRCLAMRWNGWKQKPAGNPQSRGIATWFIMPNDYDKEIVAKLPTEKQIIAKALLSK